MLCMSKLGTIAPEAYQISSTVLSGLIFSMSRSQEAFALVTCALCATEFFRKDRSGILIENHHLHHQPTSGSSSCAICPACAIQIRENDPHGQIKDLDEIRDHVKRMQDYTEGLEEAYDELLDELEQTQAEKAESQKKLDASRKLIPILKREAAEAQKANTELKLKLLKEIEAAEVAFEAAEAAKEDLKNTKCELEQKLANSEKQIEDLQGWVKHREDEVECHIKSLEDSVDIHFAGGCISSRGSQQKEKTGWPEIHLRTNITHLDWMPSIFGTSDDSSWLAVIADEGRSVLFYSSKTCDYLCHELAGKSQAPKGRYSQLSKNGRFCVSTEYTNSMGIPGSKPMEKPTEIAVYDFGLNMVNIENPTKIRLNIYYCVIRILIGDTFMMIEGRGERYDVVTLSGKILVRSHFANAFGISSGNRLLLQRRDRKSHQNGDSKSHNGNEDDLVRIATVNPSKNRGFEREILLRDCPGGVDSIAIHPTEANVFACAGRTMLTKLDPGILILGLRETKSGGIEKVFEMRGNDFNTNKLLWHPCGRFLWVYGKRTVVCLDTEKNITPDDDSVLCFPLLLQKAIQFINSVKYLSIRRLDFTNDGLSLIMYYTLDISAKIRNCYIKILSEEAPLLEGSEESVST